MHMETHQFNSTSTHLVVTMVTSTSLIPYVCQHLIFCYHLNYLHNITPPKQIISFQLSIYILIHEHFTCIKLFLLPCVKQPEEQYCDNQRIFIKQNIASVQLLLLISPWFQYFYCSSIELEYKTVLHLLSSAAGFSVQGYKCTLPVLIGHVEGHSNDIDTT